MPKYVEIKKKYEDKLNEVNTRAENNKNTYEELSKTRDNLLDERTKMK